MKNWISALIQSKTISDTEGNNLPWLDAISIHDHILNHLDPVSGKLLPAGRTLPDDKRRFPTMESRIAAGLVEGMLEHDITPSEATKAIAQPVFDLLCEIAARNSNTAKIELYKYLLKDNVLGYIDIVIEKVRLSDIQPHPYLYEFIRFLVQTSPDRGPVRFGIRMLGCIGDWRDVDLISFIGLSEDFTLYSSEAISNMSENTENVLWKLAQKVSGWGRIYLVNRLKDTKSPEIKDWLLREGFYNDFLLEFLVYTCAVSGDLRSALENPEIDEELLLSAGVMIDTLMPGHGPEKDIRDYQDGADVIWLYLQHIQKRGNCTEQLMVVESIYDYLTDDWEAEEKMTSGWTARKWDDAVVLAHQILADSRWDEIIHQELEKLPVERLHATFRAADKFKIDTWDCLWKHLKETPCKSQLWFFIKPILNPERVDQVGELILTLISEPVHSGSPSLPNYLSHFMPVLEKYPGKEWPLIKRCIENPELDYRKAGVQVLAAWGKAHRDQEMSQTLIHTMEKETNQELKKQIKDLLMN